MGRVAAQFCRQSKPQQGIRLTDFRENCQVIIRFRLPLARIDELLLPNDPLTVRDNQLQCASHDWGRAPDPVAVKMIKTTPGPLLSADKSLRCQDGEIKT